MVPKPHGRSEQFRGLVATAMRQSKVVHKMTSEGKREGAGGAGGLDRMPWLLQRTAVAGSRRRIHHRDIGIKLGAALSKW